MTPRPAAPVRLAELVASLSLATDLGLGQPQEHILRQTVIATRLSALAGASDDEQAATFYVSLLAWVGCLSDSYELGRWFDDDVALRAASYRIDRAGLPMLRFLLARLDADSPLDHAIQAGRFLVSGRPTVMASLAAHCEATGQIAEQLGIVDHVRRSLSQVMERWDGKGGPAGLTGSRIERMMRVAQIANETEVFWRLGGVPAVEGMLRERRGHQFDPALVDLCVTHADEVFAGLADIDAWSVVIDGCATLDRPLDDAELRRALETFGDYADLKSPWFLGHSRAVSVLAGGAARHVGLPEADVEMVTRAGLVCRLGIIGVAAGTWDRPGPLSTMEWDRVHAVPYVTERILRRQPTLTEIASIAGMVHERLDGSGYPRGLAGGTIPRLARILAAAEVAQALYEARPHRPAYGRDDARRLLLAEVAAGRLDGPAVDAVLAAAGYPRRRRPALPAGLTAREAEVLGLLVRGYSNRQIADALVISSKTAGSHVEHIFMKIGVSTRGSAALFALSHGLVDGVGLEGLAAGSV